MFAYATSVYLLIDRKYFSVAIVNVAGYSCTSFHMAILSLLLVVFIEVSDLAVYENISTSNIKGFQFLLILAALICSLECPDG